MTALVPVALSGRNRPDIASNDSFTVGIAASFVFAVQLECEEVHAPGYRQHGARDVAGALGTQEGDGVGHVLRLALLLHRHALDHALVERAQAGVGRDDAGRHGIARHAVARALERDRLREPDDADLARRVRRLAEATHETGDRGHADDPSPAALAHAGKHRARHLHGAGEVHAEVELPVLVAHVLELTHRVDHPGVVHADVHRPQLALDAVDDGLDLPGVADVAAVAARVAAGAADLLGRLLGALGVEVDDRQLRAFPGQHERVGL